MSENDKHNESAGLNELWRSEQNRKRFYRILRWSLGIPLLLSYGFFGPLAIAFTVLGAILIAVDVSSFLSGLFMDVIYPSRPAELQPMYGIAESLMAKGLYEEAEKEYEKIIQEFPGEVKPHIDMINIAIVRMNNEELAEQLYKRGMSLLKDPDRQQVLSETYESICSLIKTPENTKTTAISTDKIKATKERIALNRQKMWR